MATEAPEVPSLPGYTLATRLGAGGYGEVWLAQAPGGLTKAVKFIYGSYTDKRAEHELRALERVKEVRHPFLLSLERIEVVDGRLVVVTELADGSLKDRFDECRRQGLPGIARAELLSYLRDAADALDYLSLRHSLQHLDVKPENLLLVAGHVKVADFGLVKDVGKSQASLVGGLTPLYSAPEVFQGSPSAHSDQYSLAVLYQEMLTGVLPFAGVTAAELTLQHLHDEPDLSPLPADDRYVLSRALSKDAHQRYATCGDLVKALLAGAATDESWAASATPAVAAAPAGDDSASPRRVTDFFTEQIDNCSREASTSLLISVEPESDEEPVALEPLELTADDFSAQPTLVIGVGGLAAGVLRQLRLRLARQFGDDPLPAVQMLLLDSDPKTIARALQGDARTALKPEETLALPLRRPQEYRENSARIMRWLSRRWLYNIPRSLRTEGMRPLGRLALADHARQAVQRIRMALAEASSPESCAASQAVCGLNFEGRPPRVYIVASISGGSGSGMSLDVAAAARALLLKMGLADATAIGVFLRASDRDPRRCDLGKVNSFAWLTEYNQFHRPGAHYPGDDSCGLPALPPGTRPLDAAYLIDVGAPAGDDAREPEPMLHGVAEYVFLDALTGVQRFLDACRQEAAAEDLLNPVAPLRTFRLDATSAASDASIEQAAASLARQVIGRWTAADEGAVAGDAGSLRDTDQIVQGAAKLVGQMQLKLDGLASNARSLVEAQFGGEQQAFVESLVSTSPGVKQTTADVLHTIDRLFASPSETPGEFVLDRPVEAIVSPLVLKLAGDLARWVLAKLDDRQERLPGAQRAVAWLVDHLKRVDADAARMAATFARQLAEAQEQARRDGGAAALGERAAAYFRIRVDHHAVAASGFIARRLLAELKSIGATLSEFGRHVKHMATSLPRGLDAGETSTDALAAALQRHAPALTEAIDAQIQEQFIGPQGGLFQTIMGNARVRAQMLQLLTKIAGRAAEELASRPDVMNAAFSTLGADGGAATLPNFLRGGGVYRTLAIVPEQCAAADPARLGGGASSVLTAPATEVVSLCEGWRLPTVRLGIGLIHNRRDYADFAARVHTRSDVAWLPLASPVATAPSLSSVFDVSDSTPFATQVM